MTAERVAVRAWQRRERGVGDHAIEQWQRHVDELRTRLDLLDADIHDLDSRTRDAGADRDEPDARAPGHARDDRDLGVAGREPDARDHLPDGGERGFEGDYGIDFGDF